MGNCMRLQFARRNMKLTQKQFADKTGVSIATIQRLEQDETAWATMQDSTFDKVMAGLEDNGHWLKNARQKTDIKETEQESLVEIVDEEAPDWAKGVVMMLDQKDETKSEKDTKTLEMLEFVMECLRDSETHEEFKTNLKNMKRILKNY